MAQKNYLGALQALPASTPQAGKSSQDYLSGLKGLGPVIDDFRQDSRFSAAVQLGLDQAEESETILGGLNDMFSGTRAGRERKASGIINTLAKEYGTDFNTVRDAVKTQKALGVVEQSISTEQWDTARQKFSGGLRTVANWLEPVMLPQDAAFTVMDSMLMMDQYDNPGDKLKAFGQGMSRLEVAKYAPGGESPQRPASFEDVLRKSSNNEWDEGVYKWGGIVGDLTVDPLLAGAALRTVGKVSKLGKLEQMGNKLEYLTSPRAGLDAARNLSTRTVAGQQAEKRILDLFTTVMDTEIPFRMPGTGRTSTIGGFGLVDGRNPLMPSADPLAGGAGRYDDVIKAEGRGKFVAEQTQGAVLDKIQTIYTALGRDLGQSWMQKNFDALRGHTVTVPKKLNELPQVMADALAPLVYETVNNAGLMANREAREALRGVRTQGRTVLDPVSGRNIPVTGPDLFSEMSALERGLGSKLKSVDEMPRLVKPIDPENPGLADYLAASPKGERAPTIYQANMKRVEKLAVENGVEVGEARRVYKQAVEEATAADAMLGFQQTLYEPIKQTLFESVLAKGGSPNQARKAWGEMFRLVHEGSADVLKESVFEKSTLSKVFGPKVKTYEDLLGRTELSAQLNLQDFFGGMLNGHMKRMYGIWLDPSSTKQFEDAVRVGKIAPASYIDNPDMMARVAAQGYGPEVNLIQEYMTKISPTLKGEQGVLFRQANVMRYLHEKGVEPERIRDSVGAIIGQLQSKLDNTANQIGIYADETRRAGTQVNIGNRTVVLPGTGTVVNTARKDIDANFLARFAELADPPSSLATGLRETVKQLPYNQFVADTHRFVKNKAPDLSMDPDNYARLSSDLQRSFVKVPDSTKAWGSFAGQYVHKKIYRELENAMLDSAGNSTRLKKVGDLISSGLLANPGTNATNVFGGLFTAYLDGENPVELLRYMGKAAKEWNKYGDDYKAIQEIGDVVLEGARHTELAKRINVDAFDMSGLNTNTFADKVRNLTDSYKGWLEAPAGQVPPRLSGEATNPVARFAGQAYNAASGALGLKGFEFSENLFKLGMYEMKRASGATLEEAARKARFVVFDYSAAPEALKSVRSLGVLPFASFPVFMSGRAINAAVNRPGTLAASSRIGDAVWDSFLDEDTKAAAFASMREFEREGNYVPVRMQGGPGTEGKDSMSLVPLESLMPTRTFTGEPIFNMMGGGLLAPLIDIASAIGTGSGEASGMSQKYGKQVFDPETSFAQRTADVGKYMYGSYAPSFMKKLVHTPGRPGEEGSGLLTEMVNRASEDATKNPFVGAAGYKLSEVYKGKADRDMVDEVISGFFRGVRPLSLDPETSNLLKGYQGAQMEVTQRKGQLNKAAQDAAVAGDTEKARQLAIQASQIEAKFYQEWMPKLEAYKGYLDKR